LLLSMLFEQADNTVLEQRVSSELEMEAADGVEAEFPVDPYADVADMTGAVQAAREASLLRLRRNFWQLSLMPEGIRGSLEEDDVPDWARTVAVSTDKMAKDFILLNSERKERMDVYDDELLMNEGR